jgi:predicted alternative tryptophan synthase beta-subunit
MLVTSKDDAVVGFAGGGSSLAVAMWTTWVMARRRTAKFMSVFVAIFLDSLVLATCG